jgi:hypothetical protein
MFVVIHSSESAWQPKEKVMKKYGFWKFMGDVFMTCLTCGFWLIWIFVREMRKAR